MKLKLFNFSFLVVLLVLSSMNSFAQWKNYKFGKVDKSELEMTHYEKDTTASALVLFYDGFTSYTVVNNEFRVATELSKRVKILKLEGTEYATVQLQLTCNRSSCETVNNLEAYAYNLENGKVTKSKLEKKYIFEERASDFLKIVKFAIPNVKVGTVIEYRYTITSPFYFNMPTWNFQSAIPVVHARYEVKLPEYFQYNIEMNRVEMRIDTDGRATGSVRKQWEVKQYDRMKGLVTARQQDQTDRLRKEINLAAATVQNIQLKEHKSAHPVLSCVYELASNQYGSKTGNRLFLPVNILRSADVFFKRGERKQGIVIDEGWRDIDEFVLIMPEGFIPESMPANIFIENEFGSFLSEITKNGNQLIVKQQLSVKSGRWEAAAYPALPELFEKAVLGYGGKIIIRQS